MRTASLRCLLILLVLAARGHGADAPADDAISPEHRRLIDAAEHLIEQEQFDAAIGLLDRYLEPGNEDSVDAVSQLELFTQLGAIKARAEKAKAAGEEAAWFLPKIIELYQQLILFVLDLAWWFLLVLLFAGLWWLAKCCFSGQGHRTGLVIRLKVGTGDDSTAAKVAQATRDYHVRIISRVTGKSKKATGPDVMLGGDYDGSAIGSVSLPRESFLKDVPIDDNEVLSVGPLKLSPTFVIEAIQAFLRPRYQWELGGSVTEDDEGVTVAAILNGPEGSPTHINIHKPAGPGARDEAADELAASLVFHICRSTATDSASSHVAASMARAALDRPGGSKNSRARFLQAEQYLRAALDHDQLNIPARCDLAVALRQLGRNKEAVPHLRLARKLLASDEKGERVQRLLQAQPHLLSIIQYNLASTLAKQERDKAAHQEAVTILENLHASLKPGTEDATSVGLTMLVTSTLGHSEIYEIDRLRRRSKKQRLSQDLVNRQVNCQEKISQRLEALNDLAKESGRTTDPTFLAASAALLNALGRSEYLRYRTSRQAGVARTAQIGEAKRLLREAITAMPDLANACVNLASAGRYPRNNPLDEQELRDLLEHAVKLQPDNVKAHILLGHRLAIRQVGQYARAAEYLEKDPRDRWASQRLAEIYDEELNRPAAAARAAIRCLEHKTTKDDASWRLRLGQIVLAIEPGSEDAADLLGLLFAAIKHAETFAGATQDEEKKRQAHTLLAELKKKLGELRPCSVVAPPAVKEDFGGTLMLRAYRQGT